MHTKQCRHCGYTGKPVHDEYSSLLIDLFVWGFCLTAAVITFDPYIALLAVLVTLWHAATFRSHRCPRCGEWDMHRVHESDSTLGIGH
jgi:ribosomal protein L37E